MSSLSSGVAEESSHEGKLVKVRFQGQDPADKDDCEIMGTDGFFVRPLDDSECLRLALNGDSDHVFVIACVKRDKAPANMKKGERRMTHASGKTAIQLDPDEDEVVRMARAETEAGRTDKIHQELDRLWAEMAKIKAHTHPYVNVSTPATTSTATTLSTMNTSRGGSVAASHVKLS